jgi:hypothetical protein
VLRSVARIVDPEQDILFLMLTSHGTRDGLAVKADRRCETLSPTALSAMLAFTGVRHRVVILSACYSGVFIPALAGPDALVITAADAHHPSFGCKDGAKWTYFGAAFFNAALRHAANLREAFALARNLTARTSRWLRGIKSADVGRRECHTIARPFDHVRAATGRALVATSRNGLYALVPLQTDASVHFGWRTAARVQIGRLEPVVHLQLNVLDIRCEVADLSPSYGT